MGRDSGRLDVSEPRSARRPSSSEFMQALMAAMTRGSSGSPIPSKLGIIVGVWSTFAADSTVPKMLALANRLPCAARA